MGSKVVREKTSNDIKPPGKDYLALIESKAKKQTDELFGRSNFKRCCDVYLDIRILCKSAEYPIHSKLIESFDSILRTTLCRSHSNLYCADCVSWVFGCREVKDLIYTVQYLFLDTDIKEELKTLKVKLDSIEKLGSWRGVLETAILISDCITKIEIKLHLSDHINVIHNRNIIDIVTSYY